MSSLDSDEGFFEEEEEEEEPVDPFALQRQIAEEHAEREELRPPKRNNVRHALKTREWATNDEPACGTCGGRLFEADASGYDICVGCGRVGVRQLSVDHSDLRRLRPSPVVHTRRNYFNERMSQWQMQEPAIPMDDMDAMVRTYNGGLGPYEPADGVLYYDDLALCKGTVRQIIIDAGLAPKKYLEKWLTIRVKLGAEPHPIPSSELIATMRRLFWVLEARWRQNRDTHVGRKSLPNYSYIFRQLLLYISVDEYETHYLWHPVSPGAERKLGQDWLLICRLCDWPAYFARWMPDGTVQRMRAMKVDELIYFLHSFTCSDTRLEGQVVDRVKRGELVACLGGNDVRPANSLHVRQLLVAQNLLLRLQWDRCHRKVGVRGTKLVLEMPRRDMPLSEAGLVLRRNGRERNEAHSPTVDIHSIRRKQ